MDKTPQGSNKKDMLIGCPGKKEGEGVVGEHKRGLKVGKRQ